MPRFRRPSPALVVALLALTVALSSAAGANPVAIVAKAINGTSIKKHSIPLSALSSAAVKQLRGATGPAGAKGDAGATNLSVVTVTCGPAPCQTATATCPAGSHATGGGGLVVGNQLLFESRPSPQTGTPTGWDVAGGAADPPATGNITAYAVCASP
ncbi:MAG: hypothetical protein QOG68_1555 [Solirubrobacteraceae bacterium]|nr:hypothetical protein [Solirubrobacteraceae bacterium]